jgi:hypothetical protein
MLVQEHIRAVIEKFYLCTHLPIRSVDFEGIPIHSAGYSGELNELFENRNIYEKAKKMFMSVSNTTIVTVTCQKHIHYTVRQICGKNINRGFHFKSQIFSRTTL